ncbi:hypothetical protein SAMN04488564_102428 [Lentzea waywayandensis]|uniref:Uncharacterized protein n=2 Tax=Lentzea waywayandensis TaxID=84724 RepID=A0A1I6DF32_9PSEU|nr:hypothetical protein SAMN04488564_102428 [Lentzea waywayandensis]
MWPGFETQSRREIEWQLSDSILEGRPWSCQRRGLRMFDFRKNPKGHGVKPELHYSADWWLLRDTNAVFESGY